MSDTVTQIENSLKFASHLLEENCVARSTATQTCSTIRTEFARAVYPLGSGTRTTRSVNLYNVR